MVEMTTLLEEKTFADFIETEKFSVDGISYLNVNIILRHGISTNLLMRAIGFYEDEEKEYLIQKFNFQTNSNSEIELLGESRFICDIPVNCSQMKLMFYSEQMNQITVYVEMISSTEEI